MLTIKLATLLIALGFLIAVPLVLIQKTAMYAYARYKKR